MNNFYIQIIVKAYTEIEAQLAELLQNSNKARERKMEQYLDTTKSEWKEMTEGQFNHYSGKFVQTVKADLGIKSQNTIGSTNHSDPQNNQKSNNSGKNSDEGKDKEKDGASKASKSKTSKSMHSNKKGKKKGSGKPIKSKTEKWGNL